MHAPPSLPQRFMQALPPVPDWVFVGLFALIIFVGGMLAGNMLTRTGHMQGRGPEPPPVSVLQHQMELLEHRMRMLELDRKP